MVNWAASRINARIESAADRPTFRDSFMKPIHDRQPVLVPIDGVEDWLRGGQLGEGAGELKAVPVSEKVNSPRNDGSDLIEAVNGVL